MAFLCGAGSFSREDGGELWPPSTPVGSKRRFGAAGDGGGGGNPYSSRGLEKYSMLLADLETRKEKIVAAAGSQGVALVQFVSSGSGDWVPIVVRPREEPRSPEAKKRKKDHKRPGKHPKEIAALPPPPTPQQPPAAEQVAVARDRTVRKSLSWKAAGGGVWPWRPSRYLPVAVALVLLCLAVFGRAFAICCTSMWWYAVPIAAARGGGNHRGPRRSVNKEYGRRASDRRLGGGAAAAAGGGVPAAQGRMGGGLEGLASPRKQHIMQA